MASKTEALRPYSELQQKSCCILRLDHPLRAIALRIARHRWFERCIIILIVLNCITLSLNDPLDRDRTSLRNQIVDTSEIYFTVAFTIEMVLKIVALGLYGKNSYLADRWNWIDGGVVIVGYVSMAPGVSNFSSLRTFRVLRPLRTLSSIPGMRVIVKSMIASIPALFNVFLLCMFLFFVFGIIGVQIWNGVLRGRCHYQPVTNGPFVMDPQERFCALDCDRCVPTFGNSCPDLVLVDSSGVSTSYDMSCQIAQNPNFGFTGFDNIGAACLTIFTSITLEGWVDVMYALNATWGIEPFNIIYFVLLIMFGSFFLLNLALAVIWIEYVKAEENEARKMFENIQSKYIEDGSLSPDNPANTPGLTPLRTTPSMRAELAPDEDDGDDGASGAEASGGAGGGPADGVGAGDEVTAAPGAAGRAGPGHGPGVADSETANRGGSTHKARSMALHLSESSSREDSIRMMSVTSHDLSPDKGTPLGYGSVPGPGSGPPSATSGEPDRVVGVEGGTAQVVPYSPAPGTGDATPPPARRGSSQRENRRVSAAARRASQLQMMVEAADKEDMIPRPVGCRAKFYDFVQHNIFTWTIIAIILANTAVLALEHHDMDETFATTLNIMNLVFTIVFAVEMVLKLIGLGFRGYVASKFNIFDGIIVILSVVEIVLEVANVASGGSGLSALRTFRLLRVFKLARSWVDLRRLLTTIAKSVVDVANASVVLLIVMFIFCLLGMQLFGGEFDDPNDFPDGKPRAHFDNLWWAFVTVFQVLTGENWNEVLYNSMNATSALSSVYFILLNIVGNYLILNLFLAILLGNFESVDAEEEEEEDTDGVVKTGVPGDGGARSTTGGGTTILVGSPAGDVDDVEDGNHGIGFLERHAVAKKQLEMMRSERSMRGLEPPTVSTTPAPLPVALVATPPATGGMEASGSGRKHVVSTESKGMALSMPTPASKRGSVDLGDIVDSRASTPKETSQPALDTIMDAKATPSGPESHSLRNAMVDDDHEIGGRRTSASAMPWHSAEAPSPSAPSGPGAARDSDSGSRSVRNGGTTIEYPGRKALLRARERKAASDAAEVDSKRPRWRDRSLYVLADTNPIRAFATKVASHRYFEWLILALIGVSSILLAIDEPRVERCKDLPSSDSDSCAGLADFLQWADIIITALFVIEMVLKIVARGFIDGEKCYLRVGWNVLDFIIVIVSVLSLALGGSSQLKALRSLRALRALRPLRVVSRYPGLKLVVNAIFGALPKVSNVALVNLLFFLIFAIVGTQNWMGSLNRCNDDSIETQAACIGAYNVTGEGCNQLPLQAQIDVCVDSTVGAEFERVWGPPPFHFDNVANSLLTVFEVATGEMWPDIMYETVDAVGPDEPMKKDHNPAAALYFIAIQVVCAFFMLEIFTGVIIDNFNTIKKDSQGSGLLTEQQQAWVESMKLMLGVEPERVLRRPKGKFRNLCYNVGGSTRFELFIMAMIGLNTIAMAMRHVDQSEDWDLALDACNYFFVGVFVIELVIKMLGFGVCQYFSVNWNRFDCFLVVASLVGIAVDLGQLATLLRIVRVARIFRIVRTSKGLQQLFKTLVVSIPSLVNVGAVLLLVFFIYAVVGMNMFADIKHGDFLNDDANFDGFFISIVTLFRSATGESYNGIMHDCMVQEPFCDPDTNCGFTIFAPVYFISFFLFSAFILLNLLVAIILDNFGDLVELEEERDGFVLRDDMARHFREVWAVFDPDATKFIPATSFVRFVRMLEHPLGLKNMPGVQHVASQRKYARKLLADMNLPEIAGKVHFQHVLQGLVKHASGEVPPLPEDLPITKDLAKSESRALRGVESGEWATKHHLAAELLQSIYRSHRIRRAVFSADNIDALRALSQDEARRYKAYSSEEPDLSRKTSVRGSVPVKSHLSTSAASIPFAATSTSPKKRAPMERSPSFREHRMKLVANSKDSGSPMHGSAPQRITAIREDPSGEH